MNRLFSYPAVISTLFLLCFPAFLSSQTLVRFKLFPPDSTVVIDGTEAVLSAGPEHTLECTLSSAPHHISISHEGYDETRLLLSCAGGITFVEEKLVRSASSLKRFACIETGSQPKSVLFGPGGTYIFAPLLDDSGVDVFSAADFSRITRLELPDGGSGGFVECAAAPKRDELWVTRMTTGEVHIFSLSNFTYLGALDTGGEWSKVVIFDSAEDRAYVSNWLSGDISVIDTESRTLLHKLPTGGVPRGIALSGDENYVYVCLYEGGGVVKIDLESRSIVRSLPLRDGSKRHIVRDPGSNRFYVSDMYYGSIFVIDGNDDSLIREIYVGPNPNTIDLSPDGRFLFISTRGKNHPETYLRKGFSFGKIFVLDTESFELTDWTWGGNQPTGLALSPDGKLLAFSNFLDRRIEVYHTGLE